MNKSFVVQKHGFSVCMHAFHYLRIQTHFLAATGECDDLIVTSGSSYSRVLALEFYCRLGGECDSVCVYE